MEGQGPANEPQRLAALKPHASSGAAGARDLDDLAFLASLVCGMPMAVISLVVEDRQFFRSRIGLDLPGTHRDDSLCGQAILDPDQLLVVRDARLDPRFQNSVMVKSEPFIRFFAGQPLIAPGGFPLGTLCVMDRIPRDLSGPQREALGALARQVVAQLELRRDAAERQEAELALIKARQTAEKARDAAQEASIAKSFFVANMSHELRTPLNAIIGYSEMLQEEARDAGHVEYLVDLEKIHVASRHLLATINDVLDLSRIEAGKAHLHVETFDVRLLVSDVADAIRPVLEQNGNQLELVCGQGLGAMRSDPLKVRQCLINVLGNASKFTERGTVRLEVKRAEESNAQWLTFSVSDTGIGITAEQMTQIFEPFTQADATTARKYGGSGLGLSLTRKFCRLMGGDITAASNISAGSVFTIRLPAEAPQSSGPAPVLTPITSDLPAPQRIDPGAPVVLLIEDDADARDLISRLLDRDGCRVVTAGSGSEGVRLAREIEPIAIVLDVILPGMDGWEVLTALKTDPRLAAIPVIMVTMIDEPARGLALGAAAYLVKPIDRYRLVELLQGYKRDRRDLPVLVIESDATVRELIAGSLASEGWKIQEADNGVDALNAVAQRRPALIILDLMLPRMDGFEFLAQLRKKEAWRSIPIIVLTAMEISQLDRSRLEGYVQRILPTSPWNVDSLRREVETLIQKGRI